ncbi:GtrA family protein [Neolewinella agarilytica]|uniref:Putative flippase GtrA (Transmembrane translocase of bactoprenol-linked glucose) n=1 Tax=Neolewinella agarilytica TaxID=478744 RepID=A0A1H8Z1J7_9BACT|nr:GtrA family protein [Neolewinella agarilytica]SEP58335.1 Putative flippase GtrA (transmembrane translocase of bactoprenol-linked glucose) [Neolewinella agarilytica]
MMERLWQFIREKIPFAMTGLVATGINYGVYLLLVDRFLPPGPATVIAYSSSVLLNFVLQRYFVFELNRSVRSAFALSMVVSAFGLLIDWAIVVGLHTFPLLGNEEWIIKLAATGIVFFYNFYAKRRVFEGKRKPEEARPQVQREVLDSQEAHTPNKD